MICTKRFAHAFFVITSFSVAQSAQAHSLPQGLTRLASVGGFTECQLANGLRALVFPDPPKPTLTVNSTYLVGSRQEDYSETGMAHLVEHMVFKGSTKHPNIPQEYKQHDARWNGTTSYDRTNYLESVLATD